MIFLLVSILAGVLTVLAPCILPLLPIVIGSSENGHNHISKKSVVVIGSLSISIVLFTLLLKASTLLIDIPQYFWSLLSGGIILLVGIGIVFPSFWTNIPFIQKISIIGNKAIGKGYKKKNYAGDVLIGLALGPVFTTCSPTYLFIIATILPVGFFVGFIYLLGFTFGLACSLLIIAYFGGKFINKITNHMDAANGAKKIFGVLIILVGLAILTGYDKKIESAILDSGYGATIQFEESLIERFSPKEDNQPNKSNLNLDNIPQDLSKSFPNTQWANSDVNLKRAISGGPGKDGIPSIDNPKFVSIDTVQYNDKIQAIVLKDGDEVKVYPYNILNWHEIVNDTINGTPVAVTFCPLCGSAIVYDRNVLGKTLTFGVSGFLLESNMIMFDRENESLWQQSTGKILAGDSLDTQLNLIPMQLMTISEVKRQYPKALVLSENTGYQRDYTRNPYSGYEDSEEFIFSPSNLDLRFPSKTIFVVLRDEDKFIGIPYLDIKENTNYNFNVNGKNINLTRTDDILTITDSKNNEIPFYFEMWFSFIIQHGEDAVVIDKLK
jgi:cytochrome c biogenesis protein CcdA